MRSHLRSRNAGAGLLTGRRSIWGRGYGLCRNLRFTFKYDIVESKLCVAGQLDAFNTDRDFARDVLNASLTLMSILVAVITFLAVEYRGVRSAPAVMAGLG